MSKPLLSIFLIVLVDVFALTLVIPLLAIYAETFGASPLVATLLVSTFSACQLVSGPILGRLSDRYGRKPLLLISQAGTFVGLLLMAGAHSLAVLFVARVLDGATAGNLSLAQAYISDNTPPEKRTRAFAVIGIAFGVGFFLGPWITGYLAGYGLQAPILLAAGLSLTSILCTALLLPHQAPPKGSSSRVDNRGAAAALATDNRRAAAAHAIGGRIEGLRSRPVLWGLWAQFFLFSVAFALFTSGFALFAERRLTYQGRPFGPREVGYLFAYSGFLGILLQGGLIGRLVKRLGEVKLSRMGFAAAALAYLGISRVTTIPWLLVCAGLSAFGNGLLRPVLTGRVSQAAGPAEQGEVLGVNQSLASLASVLAPPLGGFLLSHRLLSTWALFAAGVALGGLVLALRPQLAPGVAGDRQPRR